MGGGGLGGGVEGSGGMLQRAVGLCVCQCHVFSGSRFKASSNDGGEGGNGYVAERVLVGRRTFSCVDAGGFFYPSPS